MISLDLEGEESKCESYTSESVLTHMSKEEGFTFNTHSFTDLLSLDSNLQPVCSRPNPLTTFQDVVSSRSHTVSKTTINTV